VASFVHRAARKHMAVMRDLTILTFAQNFVFIDKATYESFH